LIKWKDYRRILRFGKTVFCERKGEGKNVFYEKIEGDFIKKREINFIKNTSVKFYIRNLRNRKRIDSFLSKIIFVGA